MTLFWHNHFATGYTKIAGAARRGRRRRATWRPKPSEDPGQRARARSRCCATTRSATSRTSSSTSPRTRRCSFWLDGRTNTKAQPQENFGREIMELFTIGVGHYTEPDVYAAARVFTGWNLARPGAAADGSQHYEFVYIANQHETGAKTFSFPIYPDGSKTIPARAGRERHAGRHRFHRRRSPRIPNTARVSRDQAVPLLRLRSPAPSARASSTGWRRCTCRARGDMKTVVREVLLSPEFWSRRRVLRALLLAGRVRRARA